MTMRMHTSSLHLLRALALPVLLLASLPTLAVQPAPAPTPPPSLPAWEQLTPAQREQLIAPIRERWNSEPEQRHRMLERAQRWKQLTPEQRERAHRGMKRWEHMNPEQRDQMRALYGKMRTLPPAERQALKERWRQMTPEQRAEWVKANPAPPEARPPSEAQH
jgi:hypothetical protein